MALIEDAWNNFAEAAEERAEEAVEEAREDAQEALEEARARLQELEERIQEAQAEQLSYVKVNNKTHSGYYAAAGLLAAGAFLYYAKKQDEKDVKTEKKEKLVDSEGFEQI